MDQFFDGLNTLNIGYYLSISIIINQLILNDIIFVEEYLIYKYLFYIIFAYIFNFINKVF